MYLCFAKFNKIRFNKLVHMPVSSLIPTILPSTCNNSTDFKVRPEHLRFPLISRWHLGFCDVKCTPTYRGFDTFYGFYQGYIDHYSHMVGGGYDWWDNKAGGGEQSRKDLDGQYAGVNL